MTGPLRRFSLKEITAVVFSGGGSRCLWQAGMWDELIKDVDFKPSTIAAASAGATIACLLLAGKSKAGLEYFKNATRRNRKNAYWANLFTDQPVFPHYRIYRQAILELFDETALDRLKSGPEIRVQISQPPNWLGSRTGSLLGILAYSLEKQILYPMHPTFSGRLGYKALVVPVSDCKTVPELADLLLQSSCTPPFVPVMKRNGRPALDGGLIDNVPVAVVEDKNGKVLVLLSRQYPVDKIPKVESRIYLQPSEPVSIAKWDYTNPEGLQFAYDLGRKDAASLLKTMDTAD
jgi:predicted acylesterase/phospholipase RssA